MTILGTDLEIDGSEPFSNLSEEVQLMPKLIQEGLWQEDQGVPSLIGSHCPRCGGKFFPVRKVCPHCFAEDIPEISLARRGKVYSFTQVYIKSPLITEHPYTVGYVLLDDGITIPTRFMAGGEKLAIGMTVSLEVGITGKTTDGEEIKSYYFRPL